MKTLINATIIAAALVSIQATAAEVEVPNLFANGTAAVASEVNENFNTLAVESNQQNVRINALETTSAAPAITDQMICEGSYLVISSGTDISCQKASATEITHYKNLVEIFAEGWQAASVGGTGDSNRVVMLFNKK